MKAKRILTALSAIGFTAVTMLSAGATSKVDIKDVPAPTLSVGVFQVSDSEFNVDMMSSRLLNDDSNVIMVIPGGTPVATGEKDEDDKDIMDFTSALQQNKELWDAVDTVTVAYKLTRLTEMEEGEEDLTWVQPYIQGGDADGWDWYDYDGVEGAVVSPDAEAEVITFPYDKEHTWTFNIKEYMADKEGGLLKFGLKLGNDNPLPIDYKIEFTKLEITGDKEIIDKYTEKAKDLVEAAGGVNPTEVIPVSDGGGSDATDETPAASSDETKADETTKAEDKKDDEKKDDGGLKPLAIVGIVVGVVIIAGAVVFFVKKKN